MNQEIDIIGEMDLSEEVDFNFIDDDKIEIDENDINAEYAKSLNSDRYHNDKI